MMVEFLQNQYVHTLLTQHPSTHYWHNTRASTHSWHNTPRHTTDTTPLDTPLTQHPSSHHWHNTPRNTTDETPLDTPLTQHPSTHQWHNTPSTHHWHNTLLHITDKTPHYTLLTQHPSLSSFIPCSSLQPFSFIPDFIHPSIRLFIHSYTSTQTLTPNILFCFAPTRTPQPPPPAGKPPHPTPRPHPSFRQYNYGKTIFVLICTLSHETQFGSRDKNAAEFCSLNYWRCLSLTRTDVASAWCVHNDAWRRQFRCTKNQRGKTTGTSRNYATTTGKNSAWLSAINFRPIAPQWRYWLLFLFKREKKKKIELSVLILKLNIKKMEAKGNRGI